MASSGSRDNSGTTSGLDSNDTSTYDLDATDFTCGAWINADNFSHAYYDGIMGTNNASSGWQFTLESTTGIPGFAVAGVGVVTTSTMNPSANTWYFIAVVVDEGTSITFHRIDTSGTLITEAEATLNVSAAAGAFWVGDVGDHATNYSFDGHVQHAQVWDRVLTAAEIYNAAFRPGSVTKNLIGYWPAYGQLSTEPDLSTSGVDLTPANSTASSVAVPRAMPQAGYL